MTDIRQMPADDLAYAVRMADRHAGRETTLVECAVLGCPNGCKSAAEVCGTCAKGEIDRRAALAPQPETERE